MDNSFNFVLLLNMRLSLNCTFLNIFSLYAYIQKLCKIKWKIQEIQKKKKVLDVCPSYFLTLEWEFHHHFHIRGHTMPEFSMYVIPVPVSSSNLTKWYFFSYKFLFVWYVRMIINTKCNSVIIEQYNFYCTVPVTVHCRPNNCTTSERNTWSYPHVSIKICCN